MRSLLSHMIAGALGLWIASIFVMGIQVQSYADSSFLGLSMDAPWKMFVLLGIIIGLINYFVKPVLDVITLPLRIITLGILGIFINMAMVWVVDAMFEELYIPLWLPLLYTTLIIWIFTIVINKILVKREE